MNGIKRFYGKYLHNCIFFCFILAFLLYLAIESLARHSVAAGLDFLADSPLIFIFNVFIIFTTLSAAVALRRRVFLYVFFSALWLTLGIVNGIILKNRMTPFTTKDLAVVSDGLSILVNYFSTAQIALGIGCAVLLVAFMVLMFIFAPKNRGVLNRKKNAAIFLAICIFMAGFTQIMIKTGIVETFFGNLAYAYRDNGVPYCFITTWVNTGIRKPLNYTRDAVLGVLDGTGPADGDGVPPEGMGGEGDAEGEGENGAGGENGTGDDFPNIIMLQLESFFDPTRIKDFKASEDPIPYFRSILSEYSSGFLTVPAIGAGTANTEFETLTGMSVKFFGPGEYPYKSILAEETCESVPYILKNLGYSAHAIHNHRGAFYGRNKVFPNLGFDTFTSLEYMNNVAKTPRNWAKDRILTEQITDALESTEGRDYIYTISAQGHGKYPSSATLKSPRITTQNEDEALQWEYEYYANQIYEMDLFINDLTETLARQKEKVVLVMYGDHLPALEISESDLSSGTLYRTEYAIWSNFEMPKVDRDLYAYQLSAYVLERLDIHEGTMVRFHQSRMDDMYTTSYLADMRMLEYDMLYGQRYVYGGKNTFAPAKMRMGIKPILIDEVHEIRGQYYVKGQNFTEFSKISLDGNILNTLYIGSTNLVLQENIDEDDVGRLKISQVEKNKEILSTTE